LYQSNEAEVKIKLFRHVLIYGW